MINWWLLYLNSSRFLKMFSVEKYFLIYRNMRTYNDLNSDENEVWKSIQPQMTLYEIRSKKYIIKMSIVTNYIYTVRSENTKKIFCSWRKHKFIDILEINFVIIQAWCICAVYGGTRSPRRCLVQRTVNTTQAWNFIPAQCAL